MHVLFAILGLAVLALTMADALWTTMSLGRAGSLSVSRALARVAWRAMQFPPQRLRRRLRTAAGTVVVTAVIAGWAVGVWAGWSLVFLSSEGAVIDAVRHEPAGFWARLYFTGSAVVTLGLGDYRPGTPVFQFATVLAALNGFFLIALAIAYGGQVLGAVVQKQALAGSIAALGTTAEGIVTGAWNGRDFGRLDAYLIDLVPTLVLVGRQYLAYPVLHYFHSPRRNTSAALSIAALREAVLLLEHGTAEGHRPDAAALRPVRRAIDALVEAMQPAAITDVADVPPAPTLQPLHEAGIPTVDDADFGRAMGEQAHARRLLLALVEWDGWAWGDLTGGGGTTGRAGQ